MWNIIGYSIILGLLEMDELQCSQNNDHGDRLQCRGDNDRLQCKRKHRDNDRLRDDSSNKHRDNSSRLELHEELRMGVVVCSMHRPMVQKVSHTFRS